MKEQESESLPKVGGQIYTACGTKEKFIESTQRAYHDGKWYFFCTPACQVEFIQDPANSCLTSHTSHE